MKIALLLSFMVTPLLSDELLEFGFYPVFPNEGRPSASRILDIVKTTDKIIWHDHKGNFDIELNDSPNMSKLLRLKPPELKAHLAKEKEKNLVVVWFHKGLMIEKKKLLHTRIEEALTQMLAAGYKRVVVIGASGSGVHYLADTSQKKSQIGSEK